MTKITRACGLSAKWIIYMMILFGPMILETLLLVQQPESTAATILVFTILTNVLALIAGAVMMLGAQKLSLNEHDRGSADCHAFWWGVCPCVDAGPGGMYPTYVLCFTYVCNQIAVWHNLDPMNKSRAELNTIVVTFAHFPAIFYLISIGIGWIFRNMTWLDVCEGDSDGEQSALTEQSAKKRSSKEKSKKVETPRQTESSESSSA